jgi:hypothetical protein
MRRTVEDDWTNALGRIEDDIQNTFDSIVEVFESQKGALKGMSTNLKRSESDYRLISNT